MYTLQPPRIKSFDLTCRERGTGFRNLMSGDRTHGNGLNPYQEKLGFNIMKRFFTEKVVKH